MGKYNLSLLYSSHLKGNIESNRKSGWILIPNFFFRVKFGVPLDQVCKRDIPGPLLVMLLKLNKEGPFKKDVFRAPGHQVRNTTTCFSNLSRVPKSPNYHVFPFQGNMRKLIHFLQQGRLVNIHSFRYRKI